MVKKPFLLLALTFIFASGAFCVSAARGQLAEEVKRRYLISRTEEKAAAAWDVFERQPDQSLQFLTSLGETKYQRFVDRYVAPRSGESSDEVQSRLQNQPIYKADLLDMAPVGVEDLEGDPVIMRVTLGAKGELNQVRLFDSAQNKLILDFTTELSIDDREKVKLGHEPGLFVPREVRLAKGLKEPEEYRPPEERRPPEEGPPEKKVPPVEELCRDPADPACRPEVCQDPLDPLCKPEECKDPMDPNCKEACRDHWRRKGHQWGETCYDPITVTEVNCLGETRSKTVEIPPLGTCEECKDTWKPLAEVCKDQMLVVNCEGEIRQRPCLPPPVTTGIHIEDGTGTGIRLDNFDEGRVYQSGGVKNVTGPKHVRKDKDEHHVQVGDKTPPGIEDILMVWMMGAFAPEVDWGQEGDTMTLGGGSPDLAGTTVGTDFTGRGESPTASGTATESFSETIAKRGFAQVNPNEGINPVTFQFFPHTFDSSDARVIVGNASVFFDPGTADPLIGTTPAIKIVYRGPGGSSLGQTITQPVNTIEQIESFLRAQVVGGVQVFTAANIAFLRQGLIDGLNSAIRQPGAFRSTLRGGVEVNFIREVSGNIITEVTINPNQISASQRREITSQRDRNIRPRP